VIVLQTNEEGAERPICEALATTTTIVPGHFVVFSSGKLVINATSGDVDAPKMVAVENPFADVASGANIDHAYATDETVRYIWAQTGDLIYAFLATGQNVGRGASLISDGAGGLTAWSSTGMVLAFADEDLNNATGSQARLKVRIA